MATYTKHYETAKATGLTDTQATFYADHMVNLKNKNYNPQMIFTHKN